MADFVQDIQSDYNELAQFVDLAVWNLIQSVEAGYKFVAYMIKYVTQKNIHAEIKGLISRLTIHEMYIYYNGFTVLHKRMQTQLRK